MCAQRRSLAVCQQCRGQLSARNERPNNKMKIQLGKGIEAVPCLA